MKTVICAGHHRAYLPYHWKDPGALPTKEVKTMFPDCISEHMESEKICDVVYHSLKNTTWVELMPFNYNLNQKVKLINTKKFDNAIEVHLNSAPKVASGCEILVRFPPEEKIANLFMPKFAEIMGLKSRGVKVRQDLFFLNNSNCCAYILELGFINSPIDMKAVREKGVIAVKEFIHYLTDTI